MRARLGEIFLASVAAAASATSLAPRDAFADAPSKAEAAESEPSPNAIKEGYLQLWAMGLFGDGLRFNNPYRLPTPLGSNAETVSRTSTYLDTGFAATFGHPLGWEHGFALRMSFALEGVQQAVLTPSYLLYRRWRSLAAYGRAGVAVVLTPDITWGGELAAGGIFWIRGGIGICGELVGDVFYGAGTREAAVPAYPILGAEGGLVLAWERLP